jgi:hypothetical protein
MERHSLVRETDGLKVNNFIKFSQSYRLLLYWKEKEIRCRKKLSLYCEHEKS